VGVESREIGALDALVLGPLVACIVALALYPGLILGRSDPAVRDKIAATCADGVYSNSSVGTPATAGVNGQCPGGKSALAEKRSTMSGRGWTGYAPVSAP
jgi:hypothetical protein